jgi:hypothetical protein
MSDWQPISTIPIGRPVELGRFPHPYGAHEANVAIATSADSARLAFPDATHWREVLGPMSQAQLATHGLPPHLDATKHVVRDEQFNIEDYVKPEMREPGDNVRFDRK